MSATAHQLLSAIDALPDLERDAVLTALLLSRPIGGDVPETALEEMAEELFQTIDAAEVSKA